jgi:hypothetical protein
MRKTTLSAVATSLLVLGLFSNSAQAAPTRVFVGAQGSDSNTCTFASPCRSFQHAHDIVAADGEIDVLDPAGYGALTITKSISIQGHDFSGITVPSGGTGITINAGPNDRISLRGLIIEGAGAGHNGIVFNSGSQLNVANCVIRGVVFSGTLGTAILLQPTSDARFSISDTTISQNNALAIWYKSTANVNAGIVMTRLVVDSNGDGIALSQTQNGSLIVELIDSIVSHNNVGVGIYGRIYAIIDNSRLVKNYTYGLWTTEPSTTFLRRSTIFGNEAMGIFVGGNTHIYSYRDNGIHANQTDIGGSAASLETAALQ